MDKFYIGQEITEEKVFFKEDIEKFAEISGDKNPLHVNEEYAKKSRFGGIIVHGVLVMGLISKMIGTRLPGEGSVYMEQNVQFRKPVYVGEKIIAKVKIIDMDVNRKIISLKTDVFDEAGHCVIRGNAKILLESCISEQSRKD